jgi:hypothetical protein
MPMDENTKNELIKKIQEQRRALWKGEPLSNQPRRQTQSDPETTTPSVDPDISKQSEHINDVDVLKLSDLIPDSQNSADEIETKRGLWGWLRSEDSGLSWKKAIFIVSALIGAILLGIFLGYFATILEAMKKI